MKNNIHSQKDLTKRLQLFENMRLGRIAANWGTEWRMDTAYVIPNSSKSSVDELSKTTSTQELQQANNIYHTPTRKNFPNFEETSKSPLNPLFETEVRREIESYNHHKNTIYSADVESPTYNNNKQIDLNQYFVPNHLNRVNEGGKVDYDIHTLNTLIHIFRIKYK